MSIGGLDTSRPITLSELGPGADAECKSSSTTYTDELLGDILSGEEGEEEESSKKRGRNASPAGRPPKLPKKIQTGTRVAVRKWRQSRYVTLKCNLMEFVARKARSDLEKGATAGM